MQDVDLIQTILEQVGKTALQYFRKDPKTWAKPDGSVLTEADLAVNETIHTLIAKARPDDAWLSEEGPDDPARLTRQRCWIVDPIDGTRSFSLGRDEWCIGMCVVENGKPTATGVLHPATQKLFLAAKGMGATLNGKPIHVNDAADLSHARLAGRPAALRRLQAPEATPIDMSYTPQIARLAMLAAGEVDVVASFGPKHDWDIAPGALLVTEAGGKITDEAGLTMTFNHSTPRQNGLVAAGKARHAAVLKAMEVRKI
ncbi:MAG: 3'(2'),5'-bisphosphate nucleotidase CysQ [Aestuariivirga sp.]